MAPNPSPNPASTTVLVTGGTGFVGAHLILKLLAVGYMVRTTVRNVSRAQEVRKWLTDAGAKSTDRLSFHAADLGKDDGWKEAVSGCSFVHHVASPFPAELPKDENEIIKPAREGTLRVLRAARDARVQRVVITSSFAAIGYGYPQRRKEPFSEKDWSILDGKVPVTSYMKSKALAEKDAWEFAKTEGKDLELTVINPTAIFGPALSADYSSSLEIVKKLMDGSMPGCPQLAFGVVDVRDLVDLHMRAMTDPAAKGERFLAVNDHGSYSILDIAKMIKKDRPDNAKKVPTRELPNWSIHILALFTPQAKHMLPQLGDVKKFDNSKAKNLLGWQPRPAEQTILDTVDSLVKFGVV